MGGNTWQENFHRPAIVKCLNDYCDNFVHTTRNIVSLQGVYCDECRVEAKQINRKNYEDRHRDKRLSRKR